MTNNPFETILIDEKVNNTTIILNRPEKKNAINEIMIKELSKIFDNVLNDDQIKVIILTGKGDTFCSGADLEYLNRIKNYSYEENLEDSNALAELLLKIYEFPKPTIAKVNGAALAGGCGLCSVCDFIFSDQNARFGYPEVKIGFVASIVSYFLIKQIGERKARELLLTGKILTSEEALSFGIINKIVSNNQIDDYIQNFINDLTNNSGQSLKVTKSLFNENLIQSPSNQIKILARINAEFRKSDDFKEGISAFLEKRKPNWYKLS